MWSGYLHIYIQIYLSTIFTLSILSTISTHDVRRTIAIIGRVVALVAGWNPPNTIPASLLPTHYHHLHQLCVWDLPCSWRWLRAGVGPSRQMSHCDTSRHPTAAHSQRGATRGDTTGHTCHVSGVLVRHTRFWSMTPGLYLNI